MQTQQGNAHSTAGVTAALTDGMDRELAALKTARGRSHAELEVERRLLAAIVAMQHANAAARAIGYGDQFTDCLDTAVKDLNCARDMLS